MMPLECCLYVTLAFERNRITGALQLITSTEMPMNTKSITQKLHRLNAEMYCPQTLSFLRTRAVPEHERGGAIYFYCYVFHLQREFILRGQNDWKGETAIKWKNL